jgi:hypothetical protein
VHNCVQYVHTCFRNVLKVFQLFRKLQRTLLQLDVSLMSMPHYIVHQFQHLAKQFQTVLKLLAVLCFSCFACCVNAKMWSPKCHTKIIDCNDWQSRLLIWYPIFRFPGSTFFAYFCILCFFKTFHLKFYAATCHIPDCVQQLTEMHMVPTTISR